MLVPQPHVMVLNRVGYLGYGGTPLEARSTRPTPDTSAQVPVPREQVPMNSGCKNQQGQWLSEMEATGVPGSS